MVNAAVAVGQLTAKEDEMWKMLFDDDSETTPSVQQSGEYCVIHVMVTCFWTTATHCLDSFSNPSTLEISS